MFWKYLHETEVFFLQTVDYNILHNLVGEETISWESVYTILLTHLFNSFIPSLGDHYYLYFRDE